MRGRRRKAGIVRRMAGKNITLALKTETRSKESETGEGTQGSRLLFLERAVCATNKGNKANTCTRAWLSGSPWIARWQPTAPGRPPQSLQLLRLRSASTPRAPFASAPRPTSPTAPWPSSAGRPRPAGPQWVESCGYKKAGSESSSHRNTTHTSPHPPLTPAATAASPAATARPPSLARCLASSGPWPAR